MNQLTKEKRQELLLATKTAAIALLEDISHVRKLTESDNHDSGEIRRASSLLRRLLVYGDLTKVANPRIGEIRLLAPDLRDVYRSERTRPFVFLASGGAKLFGRMSAMVHLYDIQRPQSLRHIPIVLPVFDGKKTVELSLGSFLSQRVLCYRYKWVSREAVIKYVSNVASGVHSDSPKNDDQKLLSNIRGACFFSVNEKGGVHTNFFPNGIDTDSTEFRFSPDSIDVVLAELLAAMHYVSRSSSVIELEKYIKEELST